MVLDRVSWLNLGGGYLFREAKDPEVFAELVQDLSSAYGIEIFIEPGAGLVNPAGFIVSSVLDIFSNGDRDVAVLDTSVNHVPEVLEYQIRVKIVKSSANGRHKYLLVGSTCLPGDTFGEYQFDQPLHLEDRVVLADVGAYTLVKASMFNGVNLPAVYCLTEEGDLALERIFGYEDFTSRCGLNISPK